MNPPAAQPVFTAAQIARALGRSKRSILRALTDTPPASCTIMAGQIARAWACESLPSGLRAELAAQARQHGCRDAAHWLRTATTPWTPPVALAAVAPQFLERAAKLRAALAEPLARQHELKRPELRALGLREFTRVFGYCISAKQWERLFDRAVLRDAGREDWSRVEIFLDDAAFRRRPARSVPPKTRFDFRPLADAFACLQNKPRLAPDDRAWLFHCAFEHYERLLAADAGPAARRELKMALVDHLLAVFPPPGLSRSRAALMRLFALKLAQWQQGGRAVAALEDKRPARSGNYRRPDFAADEKRIRDLAIQLDGNESLAHEMLRAQGKLSPEFCAYYAYDPRRHKSYVPRAVRQNITNSVEFALPLRHSARALQLAGPSVSQDWSAIEPGDWFVADDVTWNHLFRVHDPRVGWQVLRGECLMIADAKSDYPIDYLLIAGPYNSEHILRLLLHAHDRVGLPRGGFIRERGVWSAKLVRGLGAGAVCLGETVTAFARAMPGVRFHIARTPRNKPIEGLFGRVQERMRCLPGFVGFNEQVEKREDVQKLIARARRGDPDALAFFPTQEEWRDRINGVLDDFRHSPQNGERLQGLSPAEAWNSTLRRRPLAQLTPETRYLLATHCVPTRLTPKGIILQIRGRRRCYANEDTGAWFARGVSKVLAFYNVERPELLTVSDLDRKKFIAVKALACPAMDASEEELAEVAGAKRAHLAPARAIFGGLPHDVISTIRRDNTHDETTRELGRFHNAAVAADEAAAETRARKLRQIERKLGRRARGVQNPDRVLESFALEEEARAEIAAEQDREALGGGRP
jgi:hypothetical protein